MADSAFPWYDKIMRQGGVDAASDIALKLRDGPYDDASFLRKDGSAERLVLNSFTGADITCYLVMPTQPNQKEILSGYGINPAEYPLPALKQFAELQTLTISSARSVFGVRRLGEVHVHQYTRGGRTIAGTMIMTTFSRDVFAEFYRLHGRDQFASPGAPFFVDQIPPFHLMLMAENEYGVQANAALINVSLTNFGTTMSIHDLQVEATYTYVAQFFFPFVQDYRAFQNIVIAGQRSFMTPLSQKCMSSGTTYLDTRPVPERDRYLGEGKSVLGGVDSVIESVYRFLGG